MSTQDPTEQKALTQLKDMTIKQRKFMEKYIELGNATEAAFQVYDCKDRDIAATIGWENLRKLETGSLMEAMGLTDKALLQAVAIGIAKPTKYEKTNDKDYKEVADYQTRHRYLETALKLKKKLGADTDINIDGDVTFVFGDATPTTSPQPQTPIIAGEVVDRS